MRAPPDCLKYQGPNFCHALRMQIINSFTTDIKLGLTIQRLLLAALYLVTYYMYLARERQLSHTKHWACSLLKTRKTQPVSSCKFSPFSDYVMLHEKRYQALPAFPYSKWQKAGWSLGTLLAHVRRGLITCIHTVDTHAPATVTVAVNKKFTYRTSSTYVVRINQSPYCRRTLCVQ